MNMNDYQTAALRTAAPKDKKDEVFHLVLGLCGESGEIAEKVKKIGFLAQELRKVIPEVVVGDESKENLAVNYIEIIPVLVKAIQEQQQQIDQLKKKIIVLENK